MGRSGGGWWMVEMGEGMDGEDEDGGWVGGWVCC